MGGEAGDLLTRNEREIKRRVVFIVLYDIMIKTRCAMCMGMATGVEPLWARREI